MWKRPASVVCGCLTVLPLIGCAGNIGTPPQTAMAPSSMSYYPAPRIYASRPAAPAAVLVLLPGNDNLVRDPTSGKLKGSTS
jgi:hypothetical protein